MRREILLLGEMIDAAEQAMLLAADMDSDLLARDRRRRDALLWNFTVLGEASTQLPDGFKAQRATVNWARPSGLRNRIVHGYWSVDMDILVTTAVDDLPVFVENLRALLMSLDTRQSDG